MYEALSGELTRRQELLRAAGGLVSVRDYERARQRGAPLPPLPSLVVVVDEFTELITQQESFVELFVQIGRLGRSLGLHLLLASQRLDEGKIRGLEAHLSYRIALRTFSPEESRTVIGVQDAYTLPNAPGHGLLKADTAVLTRFRTTYVSGAYTPGGDDPGGLLAGPTDVRPFPAGLLPIPPAVAAAAAAGAPARRTTRPSPPMLSVMVEQIAARGGTAHQVWLPPLADPPPLDALLRGLAERPGRGFGAAPDTPPLQVPIGHVDLPFQQRRDPLVIDLSGAGGHVGIVGRPRSGKSTMLRTLIAALALRHTPAEVQFYCLDFSGRAAGAGRAAARRRRRRPAGPGRGAPAGRRGGHRAGGPGAAVPPARRRLDGRLPAAARRRPGRPTTRSATSSWWSTAGRCCAASSRSRRRRSSRWPPAR